VASEDRQGIVEVFGFCFSSSFFFDSQLFWLQSNLAVMTQQTPDGATLRHAALFCEDSVQRERRQHKV
jgi:hypothetical protein